MNCYFNTLNIKKSFNMLETIQKKIQFVYLQKFTTGKTICGAGKFSRRCEMTKYSNIWRELAASSSKRKFFRYSN